MLAEAEGRGARVAAVERDRVCEREREGADLKGELTGLKQKFGSENQGWVTNIWWPVTMKRQLTPVTNKVGLQSEGLMGNRCKLIGNGR